MSQYNIFFVRHQDDGTEQERMNAFIRSHRVVRVRNEVFPDGWAFCVEWIDGTDSAGLVGSQIARRKEKIDYMKVLPPEVFKRFAALREVRKSLAEKAGVAAFEVLTNEQLAAFVQLEEHTLAAMGRIPGVGEARVKRFGKELLEALGKVEPQQEGEEGHAEVRSRREELTQSPRSPQSIVEEDPS